jgi:hypothetical protein
MTTTRPSFAGRCLWAALLPLLTLLSACAAPFAPMRLERSAGEGLLAAAREELAERVTAAAPPATVELALDVVEEPAQPAVEAPVARECPAAGRRVLLIGDSLSAGLAPVMEQHARACGTAFFHKGVVGSHVTQWAHDSWLAPELQRAQPDIVIISMGGNDFGRRDDANVRAGVEALVSKVRATGARLLWISPPTMPFADRIDVRGMWQSAIGGEVNVDWFPTEELTIRRTEDRIHPTRTGYQTLGKTLWQWMATVTS